MPAANQPQTNFTSGELSPRLLGRPDIEQFGNGAQLLENFTVLPQGGITRRPGTYFVAETKDSTRRARLMRFVFSTVQAYMLEFGHQYVRVLRNHARVESPPGTPVELATPWTEAQLPALGAVQSADVLFLAHRSWQPRKISRTSDTAWSIATFDAVGGPWDEKNEDASKTLTPSATTGSITITASSAVFAATDVGRLVRLRQGVAVAYPGSPTAFVVGDTTVAKVDGIVRSYRCIGAGTSAQILVNASEGDYITDGTCVWKFLGRSQTVWSSVRITGFTDSTHVTATVIDRLPSTAVTGEWQLGAWSDTTGWPQCVTFHEERIVFARGQTIWMSRTGDFPDFTPTYDDGEVVATHAITVTIADDEVQDIIWMASTPLGLLVGTRSAEYLVGQASANQPLAGDNVKAARQSDRGTAPDVPAIRAGGAVLFMQKAGRKLREMRYAYDADAYSTADATILSEHITAGGVTALAWCEEPDGLLYGVRGDGALLSLTFEPDQRVRAWARHSVGGAVVESIAAIPNPDGTADELWLIARRTIGGVTRRHIEFIEAQDSGHHVDAGLLYEGAATATVSGLGHLEGQTVKILADGSVRVPQVVAAGAVAISGPAAETVRVGLPYTHRMRTMPAEAGAAKGSAQGQAKRVHKVRLRLLESLGSRCGYVGGEQEIPYRRAGDPMDQAPPLFSGFVPVSPEGGFDDEGVISIEGDDPLPFTCTLMIRELVTHG